MSRDRSSFLPITFQGRNKKAEFNKLNFNKITSGIFSEIYSVLNLKKKYSNVKIVKFELNVQQKLNSKNDVHKLLLVL